MRSLFVFAILWLLACGAQARQAREFYTLRSHDAVYTVRLFRMEPGHLQDFVGEQSFATREEALDFLKARGLESDTAFSSIVHVPGKPGGTPDIVEIGAPKKTPPAPPKKSPRPLPKPVKPEPSPVKPAPTPSEPPVASETPAGQVIWKVTANWSWQWEQRYAEWVAREVDAEFFNRYRIPTDCADVAIATRWIFARMNGLPAANTLVGSHVLFTQDSMKSGWQKLPRNDDWSKDSLFRAALEYVIVNTDTHSLFADSYPIEINPRTFLAGAHHMEFVDGEAMGHTQLVNAVDLDQHGAEIHVLESTTPRTYRVLFAIPFDQLRQPIPGMGGLLRMRWPQKSLGRWTLQRATDGAGFSQEQYDRDFVGGEAGFSVAVKKRLASNYDPLQDFQQAVGNLQIQLRRRAGIVEDGFAICQHTDCRPETTAWNEWSTPDRDGRLYDLDHLLANMRQEHAQDAAFIDFWNQFLAGADLTIAGQKISNAQIMLEVSTNNLSPDPRDPILKRWGLLH
jgi:hypothetical protein